MEFLWVLAHEGIELIETADRTAKAALKQGKCDVRVCYCRNECGLREGIVRQWQKSGTKR